MSSPIVRKKRNFKALQLDVTKSTQPPPAPAVPPLQATEPVATRAPPQANGKKRPPPMKLAAPKVSATASPAEDNLLTVNGDRSSSAPATGTVSATRPYHNDLTQKLANLDMNAETKYDLRNEDLKELQELGQGNGGSVKKVEHVPTGKTMAKKVSRLISKIVFGHLYVRDLSSLPVFFFASRLSSTFALVSLSILVSIRVNSWNYECLGLHTY